MTNLLDGRPVEMSERAFPPDPPSWMTIVQSICIYEMREKGKEICTISDVLHWIVTEGDADTAEDFFKNHPFCASKWKCFKEKGKDICTTADVLHWIVTEGDADTAEDFFKNHPFCASKWKRFKEKDDIEALMNCIDELVEQCNKECELI